MLILNVAIQLSDLYEAVGAEGEAVVEMIDAEVMPLLRDDLTEADAIGLGDRFNRVIEKVRMSADRTGQDRVRTLKDMLKSSLATYVRKTHDAMTARNMYNRAIRAGSDTMLTVTAAAILANALSGQHSKEAQLLIQKVAGKLTGEQHGPAMENASGAAVGAGAIATGKKKKPLRRDSIFLEGDVKSVGDQGEPVDYAGMAQDIIEGDVIPFGRAEPVENPDISQAHDVSNVYMVRPPQHQHQHPNMFHVVVYTPQEGEQQHDLDLANVLDLAHHFRTSVYDRANHMWYQPGKLASQVATMHLFHPNGAELSPVEAGRVDMHLQRHLKSQMGESLKWDDLIGRATALDVLNEVTETGTARLYDGVMVDPTTAELVLSVHRSLTPKNRVHYEAKSLAQMVKIANRAVQRGLIEVSMQEG